MRVVIIGAGEVGTSIAADLMTEHEVIVIDINSDRTERLTFELDILAISGDGTSLETQESAQVGDADMFIASTDDDRTNLVACETAKALGDSFTIARVKSAEYFKTWEQHHGAFGADHLVCSDLLTAKKIVRVTGLPAAIKIDLFADGLIHMVEVEIDSNSPVAGQTVAEADRFDSLTFAGLFRNDELLLPSGDTYIEAGDRAVVIGSPASVREFAMDIAPAATPKEASEIVIAGGTEIGFHTARLLEEQNIDLRLIETDEDRARKLAEELPDTTIMHQEPTDADFLSRERIETANIVIAAMDSDERNLLMGLLAKRHGIDRVIAVVNNTEYVTLFEEIGIDVAINPRNVTAEEITRFSFDTVAENLTLIENDQAEVLELELDSDSAMVGKTIQDLAAELTGLFVIGAVTRNNSVITPRGDTELQAGDHIIVFVETSFADNVIAQS